MFFVGSKSGNYSATVTQSVSLTDLLGIGGTSLAMRQGDIVLVGITHAGIATRTLAQLTPTGYTSINSTIITATDTNVISGSGFYKFMGAAPDATITLPACGASTNSIAYSIEVWRGVDATTPLAGVAPTTATGINSGLANPPSISTPASPKCCAVFGMGGGSGDSTQPSAVFTNSGVTPYDTAANVFTSSANTTATNRAVSFMGAKRGSAVSTAFDAAITGNNSSNRNAWWALAFVLKPDTSLAAVSTLTDDFATDDAAKWNAGMVDGYFFNAACTRTVINGQLQITPPTSNAALCYNGDYSKALYKLRGSSFYVAMVQGPIGAWQEAQVSFSSDPTGGVAATIEVFSDTLRIRMGYGGSSYTDLTGNVTYDPVNHYFLKIGHDDTTDEIYVEGAPNSNGPPGPFSRLLTVARPAALTVDCGAVSLHSGTFGSTAPQTVIFDGLNASTPAVSRVPYGYAFFLC